MDYKVPDSITKDAPGSSTTVDTGKFSGILRNYVKSKPGEMSDGSLHFGTPKKN